MRYNWNSFAEEFVLELDGGEFEVKVDGSQYYDHEEECYHTEFNEVEIFTDSGIELVHSDNPSLYNTIMEEISNKEYSSLEK